MTQKIIFTGNLGRDPETRTSPSGKTVCNFSVAATRKFSTNGGIVRETTWFQVSVWGNQAEACQKYLSKGRQVYVEGRMKPDAETGGPRVFQRDDGSTGASYEVNAEMVEFLGKDKKEEEHPASEEAVSSPKAEEEIPF